MAKIPGNAWQNLTCYKGDDLERNLYYVWMGVLLKEKKILRERMSGIYDENCNRGGTIDYTTTDVKTDKKVGELRGDVCVIR